MKNSFCGLTVQRTDTDPRAALDGMTNRGSETLDYVATAASSAIAVSRDADAVSLIHEKTIIGACTGTPRWSIDEIERVRAEQGMGKSLVEAYTRFGIDLVDKLHGPFALAVVDTEKKLVLLAVDRIGINQLYYLPQPGEGFAFASHAGLLRPFNGSSLTVSDQAIYDYLYFHMVPSPGTVYSESYKLLAGERVVYREGALDKKRYWTPQFKEDRAASRSGLEEELHDLLRTSIKRNAADSNAGCFLSGGIDSSTIAGMMSEIRDPAQTFTIGFDEKGYDETSFARITSNHFGTRQHEYFVTPTDVFDILPTIAKSYDEPFGNSSVVPAYYCAKMARECGVDTLLAGDGGDELFAGNVRYVTQQIFGIYDRTPQFLKSAIIDPVALRLPGGDRFMPTRKLRSYVTQAKVRMPDRLETYNYFNRAPAENILHSAFMNRIDIDSPANALRSTYDASTASNMLNRMLELDWKVTLADNDLRKVGTMCDLAGISVEYPFLDDNIVEFSTRVPSKMKINRFRLRHFFKHAMRDYLPSQVLTKSKHGFGLPFGVWMKTYQPLRELAYDCLSQIGKRNIIRPEYMNQLIQSHQSGHAHYYGEFIWVLMMLELWLTQHQVNYEVGTST